MSFGKCGVIVNRERLGDDELISLVQERYPCVEAVVLVGSVARGDAHDLSDIDLICIGEEIPGYELVAHRGFLVSIQGKSTSQVRKDMLDPGVCAQAVPAWRTGRILLDKFGAAASLRTAARDWSWSLVEGSVERWAVETVTGFAEEAIKVVAAIHAKKEVLAATQASLIVLHLGPVMATYHGLLFSSENALWDSTGGDPTWFAGAKKVFGSDALTGARAALQLYRYAASTVAPLASARQREVIDLTCACIDGVEYG